MSDHRRLPITLLVGLVLALAPGAASAATFTWGHPIKVVNGRGDTFFGTVQCPSPTVCTAAGENFGADYDGYIATFDPQTATSVTPVHIPPPSGVTEPRFSEVSCPSVHQCTAVNGTAYTYDPASPATGRALSGYARMISCPAATQCTALKVVQYGPNNPDPYPAGTEIFATFDPQSPGTETDQLVSVGSSGPNGGTGNLVYDLACSSTTSCTVVSSDGTDGVVQTFDPQVASQASPAATVVDPGLNNLQNAHLTCPAAHECVLVDRPGREVTFDPAAPGASHPVTIDSGSYMAAVSCASATQCTADDGNNRTATFDPTDPGLATVSPETGTSGLDSIACPTSTMCVGVSSSNALYVGQLGALSAVPAPVVARPAVKGTAAAVPVTCPRTSRHACAVTLTLAARIKGHRMTLGAARRTIAAGRKATVTVRLNRTGVKALKARGRLPVTLTVSETGARPVTRAVTFRAKRR